MHQHIQSLFDGPVDVVADIHGEITAFDALLGRLGYTPDGRHPGGRRLVAWAAAYGFVLSLVTELTQVFSHGRFPTTNDLVMNTAGAAIGAWVG